MRSAKHHPGRRAPWKVRGWTDAPNALTPAEVALAMLAPVAPPSRLPDNLRSFQVGVVSRRRGGYEAYVKFCADWPEICPHGVSAGSGEEAKALAIAEHVRRCVHGEKESA